MNLLLDTNIVVYVIKATDFDGIIEFINSGNSKMYISVASEAELKSLAIRNNWGVKSRKSWIIF